MTLHQKLSLRWHLCECASVQLCALVSSFIIIFIHVHWRHSQESHLAQLLQQTNANHCRTFELHQITPNCTCAILAC
mgnify:CR=1 FL=1